MTTPCGGNNGNTTTSTYDTANELTTTTRADTPATTLKTDYWPEGSVKDQVDGAGDTTSYTYDPLGHLTAQADPLGRTTSYTHDALGNLLTTTDPGGSCTATPRTTRKTSVDPSRTPGPTAEKGFCSEPILQAGPGPAAST